MFAALLPMQLESSSFWSSEKGMAQTDRFVTWLGNCSDIDRVYIISAGDRARQLARKQGTFLHVEEDESIDGPYTFSQTVNLARYFNRICSDPIDDLIIMDHRNLLFPHNNLKTILSRYRVHRQSGMISVVSCMDHPCQFRSYHNYVGCNIFNFHKDCDLYSVASDASLCMRKTSHSSYISIGDINVSLYLYDRDVGISVECENSPSCSMTAHVLPFTKEGPLYERFQEIPIICNSINTINRINRQELSGLIITLFTDDPLGRYDTLEFFTPKNADWELGFCNTAVIDKISHTPIQGRQQFTPVYSYDGSFLIICPTHIDLTKKLDPVPFELDQSCIVTDWVDYCYYSAHFTETK